MRKLFYILVFIFAYGCQSKSDLPIKMSIDKNWQFKGVDTLDWSSATVPGNIFTDLLAHQIIEDPFVKINEATVQWVAQKEWVYETKFSLSEEIATKNNIELNFEGLDTNAKIYVNEHYQLSTDNAFRRYSIPLKNLLKKENELKIIFSSPNEIGNHKAKNNPYQLPEGNRIYNRKAQFQTGWDWGPKLNTSGIWKPISIHAWDDLKFDDIYIRQEKLTQKEALLTAEVTITSDENQKKGIVQIAIENQKIRFKTEIKEGTHTYNIPIKIENPILWWTHNLGTPYLYQFDFQLISDSKIKDEQSIKKGIRTIKLLTKKDSIGASFGFELNGKPVYMKGANYIPQHSFQNKVTHQHYEKLLSDVVESNMNMLRVWGGGIYENDVFYDLCDAKGILVWQDFMFACAMYPGDVEFLANVAIEAEQQVKRLRNHPSIALWCGNNENSEGWKRWGWQADRTEKEKEEIWNDYLTVFDTILPKIVAHYSKTDYWESSPKYGRGNPKYKTEGDAHDWWIWHDAYPFEHLQENVPRFMSEFGFQSFPSYEVLNYINQKDSVDLNTEAIKTHQKHPRGFDLIDEYMARDYHVPTNDEDYAYVSQLLQAKGIVMGIEAQRRAKPYNMGTLFWQLNDVWPAISWSAIDYFGNWKALQYKAKKAFDNVLITSKKTKYDYETYVVNDGFEEIKDTLKLKIIDFYGKEDWSNSRPIVVKANTSQKVFHIPQVDIDRKRMVYVIEFAGRKSYFYFEKPKHLELPKAAIQKRITKTKNGFQIQLKSTVLQRDVFLYTKEKGRFSDNYFDVLPNEEKVILFNTNAKELVDLKMKSLNIIR